TGTVAPFDAAGNALPGAISGAGSPNALTVDTKTGNLYVASDQGGPGSIFEYTAKGVRVNLSNTAFGVSDPYGLAYDPYNDRIYAGAYQGVYVYDTSGNALLYPSSGFPNAREVLAVIVVP
ncbi:MAG: hypothetical protein JO199_14405, partial [Candidatus Eremiobacteraeota bacterium]|nr:hypothetical protein [Candidatus Eremiobacteraeota bacterium]